MKPLEDVRSQPEKQPIVLLTLAACLIYALNAGIRSNYGILLGPISKNSGIAYSAVSFVIAVAQLFFGIMQPVFGVVAMKKSNSFVLRCGIALIAAGLLLLPFCKSMWSLLVSFGILLSSGTAALSFGIIMGTITPKLPERIAPTVSGVVSASSGVGATVFAPVLQALTAFGGLLGIVLFLGTPTLLLLPVTIFLCRPTRGKESGSPSGQPDEAAISLASMWKEASGSRDYLFLTIGFFTCGFHMAIIETHLYSELISYGHPEQIVAFAFSAYGIATMIGSIGIGLLCGWVPMKYALGGLYGFRCLLVAAFLLLPKSLFTIYAFTIFLGLTGAATVPPTSGLVGRIFGARKLATLFGVVFLAHQVGSFLSAWLGGVCFSATGSYHAIWLADAALCVVASLVSWMIRER